MITQKTVVFSLITVAILTIKAQETSLSPKVSFVAILYRHGDRTPVEPYPTDPWRNESWWPVKFGQLTNRGKQQHFALGKWLKARYSHLLSAQYDPSQIYIRSTDVDRTLMSAQANLAGMYPPEQKQVWNEQIHWQPIPIHTVPQDMDYQLAMKKKCPKYSEEMHKLKHTEEFKKINSSFYGIYRYLTNHTGMKVNSFGTVEHIYNTLYIETLYNFTLPDWTKLVYPDKFLQPADLSFRLSTYNKQLARLKVGPLVKEITEYMKNVSTSITYSTESAYGNRKKVVIFSAHDDTVAAVLNSLGLYDGHFPLYTSTIMFELIKDGGEHYVRVMYRNSIEIVEPVVLSIPSCGELCPYEKFVNLYSHLMPANWEEECNMEVSGDYYNIAQISGVTIIFLLFVILTLKGLVAVLALLHFCRRNVMRAPRSTTGWDDLSCDEDDEIILKNSIVKRES